MSLFSTLSVGASGLGVSSTWMNVIGDNIANMNTVGYKQGRASFADFLPQQVFGVGGGGKVGAGAVNNRVATLMGQGSFESSTNATDMAISGAGFFMVEGDDGAYFTRAGEFGVDDQGYVVNAQGYRLQGYSGQGGALGAMLGDLQIPMDTLAPEATSSVTLEANLSAATEVGADLAALDFYGTGTGSSTLLEAGEAADFTTSMTIYDSRGQSHDVTVLFERTSNDQWTWRAVCDASEAYDPTGAAYASESGYAFEIATGTADFDTDGNISGFTQTSTGATIAWSFAGSATPSIDFDFGLDSTGTETDGSVSMTGDESAVTAVAQDGSKAGSLTGISIDEDGIISGNYDSGETQEIGQVALAIFDAPDQLTRVGSALFATTPGAGEYAIGAAGTGGRGSISGYALEKSNVNLEEQFVQMITAQRSYQASSKVITTANDTLQQLLQLV
ncbi:MAG: flagellar hook protein FlgE [Deltaproteobacteria bacterium]|nr:flagellar hook protein FlgE [Deltaproteobacteria bacterium]